VSGGRTASTTCSAATYIAAIFGYPPGSTTRYGVGRWFQTRTFFPDARYGVASATYTGKAYLLGGGCSALVGTGTGTTANRAVYGTLQSQPQISSYSLMIDTDTDVTPNKWLINGVDNGIGAQWSFTYQSSTSANNSWGVSTVTNPLTLGSPGTYTPLNGSGTNTNTARYYYFYLTVDASNAFGFPEDATRGPTVDDITLEFTADPSKRLMHGRTFTGGLQQPEDTPF